MAVVILISDQNITGNKEGHFIMTKELIRKITIIRTQTVNNKVPKYIKQKLTEIKEE